MQPYVPELIALAVILLGGVLGAVRGLLMTVYSLVKIIAMIVLTVVLYPFVKVLIPDQLGWEAGAATLIALIIAVVALGLLAKILRLVDKIPVIHSINRIAGAILGAVLGAVLVLIALLVICLCQQAEWCREIYFAVEHSEVFFPLLKILYESVPVLGSLKVVA